MRRNRFRLPATITAAKTKRRKLRILAYSGGVMKVAGWGPVAIDLAGLELPDSVPILGDHENALDSVLGSGKPTISKGKLYIDAQLADVDAAAAVLELLSADVPLQSSVGVDPGEVRYIRAGETVNVNGQAIEAPADGLALIVRGKLFEVSILALGADGSTYVSVAAAKAAIGETQMKTKPKTEPANEPEDQNPVQAERERVSAIMATAEKYPAIMREAIESGWTIEQTNSRVLEALRASRPKAPRLSFAGDGPGGDNPRNVLSAAVLLRGGYQSIAEKAYGPGACQAANDLRHRTVLDLCEAALRYGGHEIPHTRDGVIRAAFSNADMGNVLSDAANKVGLESFREHPNSYSGFARVIPLRDFKPASLVRVIWGESAYEQVGPTGELKHGTIKDEGHVLKLDTWGKVLVLSRQHIINDDLGLLDASRALGRAGAQFVSDKLYQILLANVDSNGSAFFSSGRGNYVSGGTSALSIDSLTDAIVAMRSRRDTEGRSIDTTPRTLLVPPELEMYARSLLNSATLARYVSETDGSQPEGNPFTGMLDLAVEQRLSNDSFDGSSSTGWYLFSSKMDTPVAIGFLDQAGGPVVESYDLPGEVLGQGFRGYLDFAASLVTAEAAHFSAGA